MSGIELKPCPFCGGKAVRVSFLDSNPDPDAKATRYFACRKCCVASFTGVTDAEARYAWNRRAR